MKCEPLAFWIFEKLGTSRLITVKHIKAPVPACGQALFISISDGTTRLPPWLFAPMSDILPTPPRKLSMLMGTSNWSVTVGTSPPRADLVCDIRVGGAESPRNSNITTDHQVLWDPVEHVEPHQEPQRHHQHREHAENPGREGAHVRRGRSFSKCSWRVWDEQSNELESEMGTDVFSSLRPFLDYTYTPPTFLSRVLRSYRVASFFGRSQFS
jgi:hypothetical protein